MISRIILLALVFSGAGFAQAQEDTATTPPSGSPSVDSAPDKSEAPLSGTSTTDKVKEVAEKGLEKTTEEVSKIAKQVDQDPRANTAAAGVLRPIYLVAEKLSFRELDVHSKSSSRSLSNSHWRHRGNHPVLLGSVARVGRCCGSIQINGTL